MQAGATARTSPWWWSCARASTRTPTWAWPTACRRPARRWSTAWSATRPMPKMLLIVRREGRKLRRYVHLGTGNYHSGTARALHRHRPDHRRPGHRQRRAPAVPAAVGTGAHHQAQAPAPVALHPASGPDQEDRTREARLAKAGKPARIIAKINAINEPRIIRALYAASQAGVRIDLIVRGACALRPGVQGISDNIRVRSIVGAFSSTAAFTGSATTARRSCTAPAPTGWNAICCIAWKPASPSWTRIWPRACSGGPAELPG